MMSAGYARPSPTLPPTPTASASRVPPSSSSARWRVFRPTAWSKTSWRWRRSSVSMPSVVTANRLTDGIVVYLATDGSWTEDIARARLANTEEETKALEAEAAEAVKARKVVAVYPMEVALHDGAVDPLS